MEIFFQWETYIALLTLTMLEIILGIDNIIFITLLILLEMGSFIQAYKKIHIIT